jgi:hypothetical protein
VGRKKRESDHRLRLRLDKEAQDRSTLLPCPACEDGTRVLEDAGTYRMRKCSWCDGTRSVEASMLPLHRRWIKIWTWNKARGACRRR